jgi:O-acetyl-ADP-ribose deacetylase (regulator of RNase III)
MIEIKIADITSLTVDAIVNAANRTLLGGSGVDGAIHRAAGIALLKECKMLGGCAVGQAKITQGYQLQAKYIIHAVGPIWQGGTENEAEILAACYRNVYNLAKQHPIQSIALPAISCGVYGYPKWQACEIAIKETVQFNNKEPKTFEQIIFSCQDAELYEIYNYWLEKYS